MLLAKVPGTLTRGVLFVELDGHPHQLRDVAAEAILERGVVLDEAVVDEQHSVGHLQLV